MPILYDAVIAFLCCAGIVATFIALFTPKNEKSSRIAGILISEDASDIVNCAMMLKLAFNEVVIVTKLDLTGIIDGVMVLTPEEFEGYVTGIN